MSVGFRNQDVKICTDPHLELCKLSAGIYTQSVEHHQMTLADNFFG